MVLLAKLRNFYQQYHNYDEEIVYATVLVGSDVEIRGCMFESCDFIVTFAVVNIEKICV